jgi:hypothetical protein
MDFVREKETHSNPVDSSLKHSPKKRSISPEIKHVHNSEDHQNKRKKILIKRALLKSFISSVNTKINLKQPSLPITIPTHLFLDQTTLSDSNKQETIHDDSSIERSQRTSKRYSNGLFKHDINTDVSDGLSQFSSSSLNNQTITHQKKNKTSHVTLPSTIAIPKNEQTIISTNDTDSKSRTTLLSTTNTVTITPVITPQPKKEKPTAK